MPRRRLRPGLCNQSQIKTEWLKVLPVGWQWPNDDNETKSPDAVRPGSQSVEKVHSQKIIYKKFSHSRQANAFRHFSKGGGVKGQRLRAPAVRETASRGWRRGRRLARRKPQPEPGTTRGIAPVVLRRGRNFPLQRAQEGAGSCASCGSLPLRGKHPRRNVRRPATNFLRTAKPSSYPRSTTHRVVHGVPRCDA